MKNMINKNIFQYGFLLFMLSIALVILAGPQIKFFSEYLVHIMFAFFILGLLFLILDQKRLLITSFAISGMFCVILKNESNNDLVSPVINDKPKIFLAHYNLSNFDNPYELVTSIQLENPDIVSFQELTPDWLQILDQALEYEYNYKTTLVRIDPFGKAIFSKYPISKVDTLNLNSYQDLKIKCSIKGNELLLYSSYINPILDDISARNAKVQLENLSSSITSVRAPILAFGEYNMVYWSNEISKFRTETGLKNSRKDIVPASFKLPYEHIFYSNTLECLSEGSINNKHNKKLGYKGVYQFVDSDNSKMPNKKN